ncbi:hypothetical protein MBLNU13_g05108t1 [Cladosporium sp. NU13]
MLDDSDEGFMITHTRPRGTWEEQDVYVSPPAPALARTCSTLEKIVLPVYYGQTVFKFGSPHTPGTKNGQYFTRSQSHAAKALRGKHDPEPAKQAVANSASPSGINPVGQPPRASLLGLPKELLNHIITLAVVQNLDADLYALLSKQHEETSAGPSGQIRAFRSPLKQSSHDWLRCERRKQDHAPVHRIGIYLDPGLFNTIEYASLEFSLEDKTGMQAPLGESAYHLNMRNTCQNALASQMEEINGYGRYQNSGGQRLATLAYKLFHSPVACDLLINT